MSSHAKILNLVAGTVNGLGIGTYAVTGAMAAKGSVAAKQVALNTILPAFAIAKGFLDIIEGINFAIDKERDQGILPLPAHPRYQEAIATSEETKRYKLEYKNIERYLRGTFKALSGVFLLEGGIEACIGKDVLGLTAVGVGLLWRIAISSLVDFTLALHDFVKVYCDSKSANDKRKISSELFVKTCTAAGWTMLAILGPFNPIGLAFLGLGVVSAVIKNSTAFFNPGGGTLAPSTGRGPSSEEQQREPASHATL